MNASGAPVLADRGWKRAFDEPIPLPRGRALVTLKDAGNYIIKLYPDSVNIRKFPCAEGLHRF
jgi:hypothetical protein